MENWFLHTNPAVTELLISAVKSLQFIDVGIL